MYRKSVYFLVISVLAILALGIVMLFSTSAFAKDSHGDPLFFVRRQALWLMVGVVACIIGAAVDYHFWGKYWWIWGGVSVVLLTLCFIPPFKMNINGSRRWVNLHFLPPFQPSELAKLAAISFVAFWYSKHEKESRTALKGFLIPLGCVSILMLLIVCEVDLGATALIGGTTLLMMFIAGTNCSYLSAMGITGACGAALAIWKMPERLGRFLAFLYPEKYEGDAYQVQQGLIAFGSGGIEGLGLGQGRQKMSYLPYAHTDFIFPMIGEELGLFFTLGVVLAFVMIVVSGSVISMQGRTRFGVLLGFGIMAIIALQAAVNIGVTLELLPNKGLPLPFISYGGSNLVFCLLGVGILINIYRQGLQEENPNDAMRLNARTRN